MAQASPQTHRLAQQGEGASLALPPMLVRAEKIAATVILGVHGRRAAGPGETFWQYRPYGSGDSTQRIDWHKSAQSDRVFIRENEWESANTLWVWCNTGPRMHFRSHLAPETKLERARLLSMALASLASRAHERIGALGSPRPPGYGRLALLRVAEWLGGEHSEGLPSAGPQQRRATTVLISDFLEPLDVVRTKLSAIAAAGVTGHMVQLADPAEETLPYDGRIEFLGLDGPLKYLAKKTESLRDDYRAAYLAHRDGLRQLARGLGWSFTLHRTDEQPASVLLPLHLRVSGAENRHGVRGSA
ncbi:MAG: DUF58 domain-containing protein [Rhizobiales bacterium]|nr:DUF58 domain-containing protein [Hyphomicrobiales bacterium]